MNRFCNYFLFIFVNLIPYGNGCFPTPGSDTGPNVPIGSMDGSGTLPNDPTCQCGTFPTSGSLIATPPIIIINPFTCLITVTLQCINPLMPRVEFNGNPSNRFVTPPPYTITCGGAGEYTFINFMLSQEVVTSVTCV